MKKQSRPEHIIADGRESIRSSERYKEKEREIRQRVYQETLWDWSLTPWWKKPWMKWKIEKQIQKELDALAPRHGLYLNTK